MHQQAKDLLSSFGLDPGSKKKRSKVESQLVIATVDPSYSGSGLPKLQFAGESTVGSRLYPHAASYTPAANDKVIVAMFSHSGCIMDKIVTS